MDLECCESLPPEFRWSEASPEEVLKLKPVADLKLNINSGHPRGYTRYYFVAGGFAAYVAGRTTTYDDIDVYTNAGYRPRRLTFLEYPGCDIDYIDNKYPYQYIHTVREFKNVQEYMMAILKNFDIDLCAIAYCLDVKWNDTPEDRKKRKYYKMERKKDLCLSDVMKFSPKRIQKYASRVKTPFNLKFLALSTVLDVYDKNDVFKYLNKISMSF